MLGINLVSKQELQQIQNDNKKQIVQISENIPEHIKNNYKYVLCQNEQFDAQLVMKELENIKGENITCQQREHQCIQQMKQYGNDCLPIKLKGQLNNLFKIPNTLAATAGIHEALLLTMIQNGQKKKHQNIVLTGNPNVDMAMKVACYSSKLIRPFLGDLKTVNKVSDRAEVMRDRTNMTTTLKEKVKDTFLVYSLLNSKQVQSKELYKSITTQFGLLKENSQKHLQVYGFFSNTYYYFRGGAVAECEDFGILKKMQQHHKLSKQLVKYVSGNDFIVDLICNPNLSLYSLEEEIGVNRIINYSAICGLCGLIPQTFNLNEDIVDMDGTNYIIDPSLIDSQVATKHIIETQILQKSLISQHQKPQAEDGEMLYVQKPSFKSLLNPEENLADPGLEEVNRVLASVVKLQSQQNQNDKLNNKLNIKTNQFVLKHENTRFNEVFGTAKLQKTQINNVQERQVVQKNLRSQNKQGVTANYQQEKQVQYYQPIKCVLKKDNVKEQIVLKCNCRQDQIHSLQNRQYKTEHPPLDSGQQPFAPPLPYQPQHPNIPNTKQPDESPPIHLDVANPNEFKQVQNVEGLYCPVEQVNSLEDFVDFQLIIIDDTFIENVIINNISKCTRKQNELVQDIQKVFNNLTMQVLIDIFNKFRHCDLIIEQIQCIRAGQFLRKCFVDGMRKQLAERLSLQMICGLQTKEVLEILICAQEITQIINHAKYNILVHYLSKFKNCKNSMSNEHDDLLITMQSKQSLENTKQNGILMHEENVSKLEDFVDCSKIVLSEYLLETSIMSNIGRCKLKQKQLCQDIESIMQKLNMQLLINIFNSFRGCNVNCQSVQQIQPILFLRRCFIEAIKKELLQQINIQISCGLELNDIYNFVLYSPELLERLDKKQHTDLLSCFENLIKIEKSEKKIVTFQSFVAGLKNGYVSLKEIRKNEELNELLKMYKNISQKKPIQQEYLLIMKGINLIYDLLKNDQDKIRGFIVNAYESQLLQLSNLVIEELKFEELLSLKENNILLMISFWYNGYRLVDFTNQQIIEQDQVNDEQYEIMVNNKSKQFQTSRLAVVNERNIIVVKQSLIGVQSKQNQPKQIIPTKMMQYKFEEMSADEARKFEYASKICGSNFIQKYQQLQSKEVKLSTKLYIMQKYQQELFEILRYRQNETRRFLVSSTDNEILEYYTLVINQIGGELLQLLQENDDLIIIFFSLWFNEYSVQDFANGKNINREQVNEDKFEIKTEYKQGTRIFQTSKLALVDKKGDILVKQCLVEIKSDKKCINQNHITSQNNEQVQSSQTQVFESEHSQSFNNQQSNKSNKIQNTSTEQIKEDEQNLENNQQKINQQNQILQQSIIQQQQQGKNQVQNKKEIGVYEIKQQIKETTLENGSVKLFKCFMVLVHQQENQQQQNLPQQQQNLFNISHKQITLNDFVDNSKSILQEIEFQSLLNFVMNNQVNQISLCSQIQQLYNKLNMQAVLQIYNKKFNQQFSIIQTQSLKPIQIIIHSFSAQMRKQLLEHLNIQFSSNVYQIFDIIVFKKQIFSQLILEHFVELFRIMDGME